MKRLLLRLIFLLVLLIGLFLPSVTLLAAGTQNNYLAGSNNQINATPTPTNIPDSKSSETQAASIESSRLDAFIQAPPGIVDQPYVILSAVELVPSSTSIEIRGSISDRIFLCESTPCTIPVPQSDRINFTAYSSSGYASEEITASVTVTLTDGGYSVIISSINRYTTFLDSCGATWRLNPNDPTPLWAEFSQFPYELNTERTLHYLATKLIISGIVDASSCPSGGLNNDLSWPTACGLEQAKDTLTEWQNQYDSYIWTASKDVGIPPKILKTLIQVESQFWPANQRFYVDEYGLGQITQLGVDILLRQDNTLFQSFCPTVLNNCNTFYSNLSSTQQAMVRGALLSSLDATCPTCEHGFDFTKAGQSIYYIARLLDSKCQQNRAIMNTFGSFSETEYEDYWKFTLFSYHSGTSCFYSAAKETKKANEPMTWEYLSEHTACIDGKGYVDGLWGNLVSFDNYLYQPSELNTVFAEPVFEANPTPVPLPTAIPSEAQIHVQVLLTNDQTSDDGDTRPLDNIRVTLTLANKVKLSKNTSNGEVYFDMSEQPAGTKAVISLPGLYRREDFELPSQGVKEIVFIFSSPVLPQTLP